MKNVLMSLVVIGIGNTRFICLIHYTQETDLENRQSVIVTNHTTRQNEKPSRASVFVHLAQGLIGVLSGEQNT